MIIDETLLTAMLYPLKFRPRLKARVWGGDALLSRKGAFLRRADKGRKIGESWDISCMKGDESVVSAGLLKGNNLRELVEVYMGDLTGEKLFDRFGEMFPLLVKTLDCRDRLSVQVHPGDALAAERHDSFGKTEMWYILSADEGASLYVGLRDGVTREEYLRAVSEGSLPSLLNRIDVARGDVLYIPAGTVHAIAGGVYMVEIQQSSDITYRIYDWDRTDDDGHPRELHTALAVDAIDFDSPRNYKIDYRSVANQAVPLVSSPCFTVNLIDVEGSAIRDREGDTFAIYVCVGGSGVLHAGGFSETMAEGESVLVPADLPQVEFEGCGRFLEAFVE